MLASLSTSAGRRLVCRCWRPALAAAATWRKVSVLFEDLLLLRQVMLHALTAIYHIDAYLKSKSSPASMRFMWQAWAHIRPDPFDSIVIAGSCLSFKFSSSGNSDRTALKNRP